MAGSSHISVERRHGVGHQGSHHHTDMDDMAEGTGRDVAGARSRQGFWAMEKTGTHKISLSEGEGLGGFE